MIKFWTVIGVAVVTVCGITMPAIAQDTAMSEAVLDCQARYGEERSKFVECLTTLEEDLERYQNVLASASRDPSLERLLKPTVEQCADIWQGNRTLIGYCAEMQWVGFKQVIEIQNAEQFPDKIKGPILDECYEKWQGHWGRIAYCTRNKVVAAMKAQ